MNTYLAYIRGLYVPLGFEELFACLNTEKIDYKLKEKGEQYVLLESNKNPFIAAERCAFLHSLIEVIAQGKIDKKKIIVEEELGSLTLEKNKTFSVRLRRIGKKVVHFSSPEIERKLGDYVFHRFEKANISVNLKEPFYEFVTILNKNKFYLGLKIWSMKHQDEYQTRDPGKRPYFRPGAMKTDFARAMVNLARVKKGDILLDPFCGSGGFLLEALLLGAYTIGFDIDFQAVNGAQKNLSSYKKGQFSLLVGDSRNFMFKKVDAIVTDPPYSIQSSTFGNKVKELITDFLKIARRTLSTKGYLVLSCPKEVKPEEIAKSSGFKLINIIDAKIHKSLTRRIIVLK
ncbi:MAG: DNA methyltransferase [Candidatus Heimdallarchaeaceae archaeon]